MYLLGCKVKYHPLKSGYSCNVGAFLTPSTHPYIYIYYLFIYLEPAHKNHDHKKKRENELGRSVRPGETQKMGSSELKNIDNKKKWQGIGRKAT